MAHIQKFQQHALGHMCKHFERALDANGEPIKYGNQNIDLMRTHLNYNLAPERENQYGFIMDRCKEVYCLKRKDVNLMCSCIVTAPKDLPAEEHERFFRASYDFLAARYGGKDAENVVSAYVHMDEGSPHLHFAFVPVCYDKSKERWTVSAKNVVNRQDLKTLHPDLERHVTKELGHDVHVLTGELSNRPNLTIPQYQEYQDTLKRLQEAQKSLQSVEKALEGTERRLAALNAEYEPKKAYIEEIARIQEGVDENVREKTSFTGKKTVEMPKEKWDDYKMTYMDKQAAQKLYDRAVEMIRDFQSSVAGERYAELLQELKGLRETLSAFRESNARMAAEIDKVNEVFEANPEAWRQYSETIQALEAAERSTVDVVDLDDLR